MLIDKTQASKPPPVPGDEIINKFKNFSEQEG
jgi:hypothetical protein